MLRIGNRLIRQFGLQILGELCSLTINHFDSTLRLINLATINYHSLKSLQVLDAVILINVKEISVLLEYRIEAHEERVDHRLLFFAY